MACRNALRIGPERDPFRLGSSPVSSTWIGTYVTFRQSLKSTSLPCGLELVSREFLSLNNKPRRGCRIVRAWDASPTILRVPAGWGRGGKVAWGAKVVNIIRRNCRNCYIDAVMFPSRKIVACTSYFFSFRLNSVALQLLVPGIDQKGGGGGREGFISK